MSRFLNDYEMLLRARRENREGKHFIETKSLLLGFTGHFHSLENSLHSLSHSNLNDSNTNSWRVWVEKLQSQQEFPFRWSEKVSKHSTWSLLGLASDEMVSRLRDRNSCRGWKSPQEKHHFQSMSDVFELRVVFILI